MKKYSAYFFLPLLLVFALCISSCDDDDDDEVEETFHGVWTLTSQTQEADGFDLFETNPSGTITLNEDGTGSRMYDFTSKHPITEETTQISVLDEITYVQEDTLLKITTVGSGNNGIQNWERTVNTNTKQVMSVLLNIDGFATTLTITMEK